MTAVARAGAAGVGVIAVLVAPIVAAGGGRNMAQALSRLATHDMLSGNACNLWWIVGYLVRASYSVEEYGVWGALSRDTRVLQTSRFMEVGYPDPRLIGAVLAAGAIAWGVWNARRSRDVWLASALGAFLIHAYATLAAQVHENHLYAAVPLLTLAAAGRRRFVPVLVAVSIVFGLNLNVFYGISEEAGYAIPRSLTPIDLTVVLALANCAVLVWHAAVLRRECLIDLCPRS